MECAEDCSIFKICFLHKNYAELKKKVGKIHRRDDSKHL